jgi:3-oxoacyl-(acyl-carrier-protein) synthase
VVSTKGATGHTLGAAGGVEAVFTLMALNRGELAGTVGCLQSDPEFPFPVLDQKQSAVLSGRIGISQSLAFGGSNGALVIEGSGK